MFYSISVKFEDFTEEFAQMKYFHSAHKYAIELSEFWNEFDVIVSELNDVTEFATFRNGEMTGYTAIENSPFHSALKFMQLIG